MNSIRKIAIYTSFLLSFSAQLPSFELQATAKMTVQDFQDLELEKKFPMNFRGFSRTDLAIFDVIKKEDDILKTHPSITAGLKNMLEALKGTEHPRAQTVRDELAKIVDDESKHNVFYYVSSVVRALIMLSEKTDDEEQFFKAAGFSQPYSLINALQVSESEIWGALNRMSRGVDEQFDFSTQRTRLYYDYADKQTDQLDARAQRKRPVLVPAFGEKEDLFGFFYLAWLYSKGIHPIPVTFKQGEGELHGIKMSPWGKACHDLAHHQGDADDNTIEKLSDHILNHYVTKLKEHAKKLSPDEKKKYATSKVLAPVTEFAVAVHEAYKSALTAVLEKSLTEMGVGKETTKLPDNFKAFSVSAFVRLHETPIELSRSLATSSFSEILTNSVKPIIEYIDEEQKPSQEQSSDQAASDTGASIEVVPSIKKLIPTSIITGETSLTDEEIINIVQERPSSEFRGDYIEYIPSMKINKEQIASVEVTRNKFYIQVTFDMLNGASHAYRMTTEYADRLNLHHDREFLIPAKAILTSQYSYTIPTVPVEVDFADNASGFEAAVTECRKSLNLGRKHLLDYFVKTARELSEKTKDEQLSIADQFALKYSHALRKLQDVLPSFVETPQQFIAEAIEQSKKLR